MHQVVNNLCHTRCRFISGLGKAETIEGSNFCQGKNNIFHEKQNLRIINTICTRTHNSTAFSDENANAEPEETQHEHHKIFHHFDPNVARWRFADAHRWLDDFLAGLVSECDDNCK